MANPIIHTFVHRYVFPINTHSKKLNFPVHRIIGTYNTIVCTSEKILLKQKLMELCMLKFTEDGSMKALLQILYGQYLILGVFGSYMF